MKRWWGDPGRGVTLLLAAVTLLGMVAPARPVRAGSAGASVGASAGAIVIKYRETGGAAGGSLMQALGQAETASACPGMQVLSLAPDVSPEEAIRQLAGQPGVEFAAPLRPARVLGTPDPLFPQQWNLAPFEDGSGQYGVSAEAAWDLLAGRNLGTVRVAVVDSGVDAGHEDLTGQVLPGRNVMGDDPDVTHDDNGHGTHVAGMIAALAGNGKGIAGLAGVKGANGAPAVEILPVKAADAQGQGTNLTMAEGICWAAENGARVINVSMGEEVPPGETDPVLAAAVRYAQDRGALVVAAAGNAGIDVARVYPAALPGVVAVAATNPDGNVALWSDWGDEVDLAAPGEGIWSTTPALADDDGTVDGYTAWAGTSMATPHVSALAALVWAIRPDLTPIQVSWLLEDNAVDIETDGWDEWSGHGLVDAAYTLAAADDAVPAMRLLSPASGSMVAGTVTVTAAVADPPGTAGVELYLDDAVEPFQVLENPGDNPLTYTYDWTPLEQGVAEGPHTLTAVVRATDGNAVAEETVDLTVVNPRTGLFLQVLAPNGQPAAGAGVSVYEIDRTGGAPERRLVWNGAADEHGEARVPDNGSYVRTGMEWLVGVNGPVPGQTNAYFAYSWVLDTADPATRGRLVLETADAVPVTARAAGVSIPWGRVLLFRQHELLGEDRLASWGAEWHLNDGLTAPPTFWVQPGTYDLVLAGLGEDGLGYYLALEGQQYTPGRAATATFATSGLAELELEVLLPEGSDGEVHQMDLSVWPTRSIWSAMPAGNGLSFFAYNYSYFLEEGETVRFTPGRYGFSAGTDIWDVDEFWSYTWHWQGDLAPGRRVELLGGEIEGQLVEVPQDPERGPNAYHPHGWAYFGVEMKDAQGHEVGLIDEVAIHDDEIFLVTEPEGTVVDGLDPARTHGEMNTAFWYVNGYVEAWFDPATAPTSGQYRLEADVYIGPLSPDGYVTAASEPFTMQPAGPRHLDLTVVPPAGEEWAMDTTARLWLYQVTESDGHAVYQPIFDQTVWGDQVYPPHFKSTRPQLAPDGRYHAVFYTYTARGLPLVYSQPISADDQALGPEQVRPVRVRAVAPDGTEYTAGGVFEGVTVRQGDQALLFLNVGVPLTAGEANLYLDPGTYHLYESHTDLDENGEKLFAALHVLGDTLVDSSTTEVLHDLSTHAKLQAVLESGETGTPGLRIDLGALGGVLVQDDKPLYVSPGEYRVQAVVQTGDEEDWPEAIWTRYLRPFQADADGIITLAAGDAVGLPMSTWLEGQLTIAGGQAAVFQGEELPSQARFVDRAGNVLLRVQRDLKWGPVLQSTDAAGGVTTMALEKGHWPVFTISGPGGVVFKDNGPEYLQDFVLTLPADLPEGEYTARLYLDADGLAVVEAEQQLTVKARVTLADRASAWRGSSLTVSGLAHTGADHVTVTLTDGRVTLSATTAPGADTGDGRGEWSARFAGAETERLRSGTWTVTAAVTVNGVTYTATDTLRGRTPATGGDETPAPAPGETPPETPVDPVTPPEPPEPPVPPALEAPTPPEPAAPVILVQPARPDAPARVEARVEGDGTAALVATVDPAQVQPEALGEALTIDLRQKRVALSGGQSLPVQIKTAEVPAAVLGALARQGKLVVIQAGSATLAFAPDTFLPAAQQAGADRVRLSLRTVNVTDADEAETGTDADDPVAAAVRQAVAAAAEQGLRPAGQVLVLTAEVAGANGTAAPVTAFVAPVTVVIPYTAAENPSHLGVYRLNPATGEWEYRGGKVDPEQQVVTVTLTGFSEYAVMEHSKTFADVPAGHWAKADIELMAARHVVKGTDGERFRPEAAVSRAQFVAMLVRALGLQAGSGASGFSDVAADAWYADEVAAAAAAGLVQGSGGAFRPDDWISRQELAVLLGRALTLRGRAAGVDAAAEAEWLRRYADGGAIAGWARSAVAQAAKLGLMTGRDGGRFAPADTATRAEATVVLKRLLQFLGEL